MDCTEAGAIGTIAVVAGVIFDISAVLVDTVKTGVMFNGGAVDDVAFEVTVEAVVVTDIGAAAIGVNSGFVFFLRRTLRAIWPGNRRSLGWYLSSGFNTFAFIESVIQSGVTTLIPIL